MGIESINSRIAEVQSKMNNITQRPANMFETVFQEKLGFSPNKAANTSAADIATAESTGDAFAALNTQSSCALCALEASQQANGTSTVTWNGELPEGFEKAAPYMEYVYEASERYGMPVNLILGIMKAESDFNNECVSYAGAKGLMQLMPETAAEVGVTDEFDPRQNILGSVEYVTKLINKYDGDVRLALAAYNTGPGKIARRGVTSSDSEAYLTVPQSIRDYAERVLKYAGYDV